MKSLMVKDELQKQVKSFAAQNSMSMIEVVEYALKEYFEKGKVEGGVVGGLV